MVTPDRGNFYTGFFIVTRLRTKFVGQIDHDMPNPKTRITDANLS